MTILHGSYKMLEEKINKILFSFIIIFIILLSPIGEAQFLDIDDTYNFDDTSFHDLVAFEDYDFDFQVGSIDSGADMVCFNWDLYGGTDAYEDDGEDSADFCVYTSTTTRNACISCYGITVPLGDMEQKSSLTSEVHNQVCDGCDFDTSDRYGDYAEALIYHDCSVCSLQTKILVDAPYFVIRPREYLCYEDEDNEFILHGDFPDRENNNNFEWVEYDNGEKVCSDIYNSNNYACDTDNDQVQDNSGVSTLANPCALVEGVVCSLSSQCISDICDGHDVVLNTECDSDGSQDYSVYLNQYDNSCGGEGLLDFQSLEADSCNSQVGVYYVCDSDLTGNDQPLTTEPEDFCRLNEYASCTSNSQCWNDNGGYDCMGSSSKICTTGANGKSCFGNDDLQCDSGRCDSTCQARLTDGQSCDENSDCINGICSGGICGGAGVTTDLAVVDIEAIQIIPNVNLLKGRTGIIRVTVTNYGPEPTNGTVTAKFDGSSLSIASGDTATKPIPVNQNVTFLFDFTPSSTGTKGVVANVTIV
ncbi:hypothetical protein J4462_01035 [Candidatus Pacearchaeota archaeon]|nr:hypothetical protein [Candidatus Pacearchaeota archaeon]